MMMDPKAFLPAFKQTRHGRLFELIRQRDKTARQPAYLLVNDDTLLAFRDMAAGSLRRAPI